MSGRSTRYIALGIFALLGGNWSMILWAADLYPGWIEGQANVSTTDGQIVQSLSMNAYGGGYTASKPTSQRYPWELTPLDYSMTVQGGEWDYRVVATATARTNPASCPTYAPSCYNSYTNIYFSDRYFPVATGETVTNDYATDATIQFQLDISDISPQTMGSTITHWYVRSYAVKTDVPAGDERTNSQSRASSYYSPCATDIPGTPCGAWDMPLVGNPSVRVYAYVYVYGTALREDLTTYSYNKTYNLYTSNDDLLYADVGTNETNQIVVVPLTVEHVAPPASDVVIDSGSVEGNVFLDLNIGGEDYSGRLRPNYAHYVRGYGGQYVAENGGGYLLPNERVGLRTYSVQSYFDNGSSYLRWPYTDGDYNNDQITIEKDQFYTKDFSKAAGLLNPGLRLQGTLKTANLSEVRLYAEGARFYEPAIGWVNQPTYGGSSYSRVYNTAPDIDYELILTEGPWQTPSLYARSYNYDPGYYVNWQMNLTDYNYYYDGSYYDFGQTLDITAGQITDVPDRKYKTGSWETCFRVVNAPGAEPITFQNPSVSAWANHYNQDDKREMYVSLSGNSNSTNEERPTAKIHGPGGEYSITPRAQTSDGTTISFPTETQIIKENIERGSCLTAPEVILDPYPLETNGTDITVSGDATDEDGIASVIFSLNGVEVHRIDYRTQTQAFTQLAKLQLADPLAQEELCYGLPCSVIFSYLFDLAPGINTLRVTVMDGLTNESWEEWETFVNSAPEAMNDVFSTDEDVALNVPAPGVLGNDTDVDEHALVVESSTEPAHGSLVINPDGSFTYTPDENFHGDDSFSYTISDGHDASAKATVSLEITSVNDLPVVTPVTLDAQTVQYGDRIAPVTIEATDVDSGPLTLSAPELLGDVTQTVGCTVSGKRSTCSWTVDGQALVVAGTHTLTFQVDDGAGGSAESSMALTVTLEDATADFGADNPAAVAVATPGGVSGPFTLTVHVSESQPDEPIERAGAGDIANAEVSVSLVPVGPGATINPRCGSTTSGSVQTTTCDIDAGVPVNTYTVAVEINGGGYYTGSGEDVLTVYDPSLGFTTGGGWFYWPGTSDKTNFGYTMKYGKKGTNVRGSLLLIRHLADGQKYRIKSNALSGLAIGDDVDVPYGWASFSGKSTYLEPGMSEPEGNHGFTVYVEDRNEPGSGTDRFWITTRTKDGGAIPAMSLAEPAPANAVAIQGGNIVAPH